MKYQKLFSYWDIKFRDEQLSKSFLVKVVTLFNNFGYLPEEDLEQFLLDAYIESIDTTSEIHKIMDHSLPFGIKERTKASQILQLLFKKMDFRLNVIHISILISSISDPEDRAELRENISNLIQDHGIALCVVDYEDKVLIIPSGSRLLDEKNIVDVLNGLQEYSKKSAELFYSALELYRKGDSDVQVITQLRLSIECFLHDYLDNKRNFDNNIPELFDKLSEKKVPAEFQTMIRIPLDRFNSYDNNNSKHHAKTDERFTEFLLYQIGNILRTLMLLDK